MVRADAPGRKLLGRPSFADSSYLLTGFLKCEQCGKLVFTESHVHGSRGKRFTVPFYGCTTHRRSGAPACANEVMLRQELLDSALNQLAAGHGRQQDRRQHIERELNPCFVRAG